jgi:multidrug efflux pump
VRDSIYLVNVVGRAKDVERSSVATFQALQIPGKNGSTVLIGPCTCEGTIL